MCTCTSLLTYLCLTPTHLKFNQSLIFGMVNSCYKESTNWCDTSTTPLLLPHKKIVSQFISDNTNDGSGSNYLPIGGFKQRVNNLSEKVSSNMLASLLVALPNVPCSAGFKDVKIIKFTFKKEELNHPDLDNLYDRN